MTNFQVVRRNYGHWDIYELGGSRMFKVRGGPSKYWVSDERDDANIKLVYFKTVGACMSYICDELMFELIIAEGQDFDVIESWNV